MLLYDDEFSKSPSPKIYLIDSLYNFYIIDINTHTSNLIRNIGANINPKSGYMFQSSGNFLICNVDIRIYNQFGQLLGAFNNGEDFYGFTVSPDFSTAAAVSYTGNRITTLEVSNPFVSNFGSEVSELSYLLNMHRPVSLLGNYQS